MSKNKLAKFAEMATYPHVFQPESLPSNEDIFPLKGHWHSDFFHNDHPITLELGCGRGEYTVELARRFPDKNFIGVDIKGARMWTGATESLREGLPNVAFLRTRIEFIAHFFDTDEVSEIWLTFSDFLQRYRSFLCDGGRIHVKTDSHFLYTYTDALLKENHLLPLCATTDLYSDETAATLPPDIYSLLHIRTYYEEQWLSRGIPIKFLSFALPHDGELREPDIEIEMDSYRSYARNKRSSLTTSR